MKPKEKKHTSGNGSSDGGIAKAGELADEILALLVK